MNKILTIYPHFPPSNLVGVHRIRLFAQHLPSFGWEPIILTVHENFYEEKHDYNLVKLLPTNLRIEKVNAFSVTKPRLIGDVGLRGFFQLYKKAKAIINSEKIDFILLSIPSFYCALLGRWLHASTGVKYGIDYQDPWVHNFPGSNKIFSRHWFSSSIAKFLEPIAVKNAALICGVSESYYLPVLERNPPLKKIVNAAMPMGGEILDHQIVDTLNIEPYLFKKNKNKLQFVYAGAMLPKAYQLLEQVFTSIVKNKALFENVEFHFIGTGKTPNDVNGFNIKPLAQKYGLWKNIVFEYPARIPYLDALVHLNIADAIFILGSTEAHYTPSKVYQAILSNKPILAILHTNSTAVNVIRNSNAGIVLDFNGVEFLNNISENLSNLFVEFVSFKNNFTPSQVNQTLFNEYSAFAVTKKLAALLNQAINKLD